MISASSLANRSNINSSSENVIVVEKHKDIMTNSHQAEEEIQQDSTTTSADDHQQIPKLITPPSSSKQSSPLNFLLLSTLFIITELIIYLYHDTITSHLLLATNCPYSVNQSPEFSTIACLSPRRVIYGTWSWWSSSSSSAPSASPSYTQLPQLILSILLQPLIFPNWIALSIGLIILYNCLSTAADNASSSKPSIFHLLIQLYQIQWSTFVIRMVISFIRFRAFGWTESLLWAFDAFHFVSCNAGGTSFVFYHLVRYVSDSDDKERRSTLKMILLVVIAFALHFTSHLPLSYIPFVSSSISSSIPSNYLIDHISACILTIVFSD